MMTLTLSQNRVKVNGGKFNSIDHEWLTQSESVNWAKVLQQVTTSHLPRPRFLLETIFAAKFKMILRNVVNGLLSNALLLYQEQKLDSSQLKMFLYSSQILKPSQANHMIHPKNMMKKSL